MQGECAVYRAATRLRWAALPPSAANLNIAALLTSCQHARFRDHAHQQSKTHEAIIYVIAVHGLSGVSFIKRLADHPVFILKVSHLHRSIEIQDFGSPEMSVIGQ